MQCYFLFCNFCAKSKSLEEAHDHQYYYATFVPHIKTLICRLGYQVRPFMTSNCIFINVVIVRKPEAFELSPFNMMLF